MRTMSAMTLLLLALTGVGCSCGSEMPIGGDAGALDAGPGDAGQGDAGAADSGPADAGAADAGPVDGGPTDAGPADAGRMPSGPSAIFPTSGGASASSPGYRAQFSVGAPQPMGAASAAGRRVRLGPVSRAR